MSLLRLAALCSVSTALRLDAPAVAERRWSRAAAGELAVEREVRLREHRKHQERQKARHLARLDRLLECAAVVEMMSPVMPVGSFDIDWSGLPPGCDPCGVASRMSTGTLRGQRKRESVGAMASLLEASLLSHAGEDPRLTILDAGCGTGSLLLPLAALFPNARFVGIDAKAGSLERLMTRAAQAGLNSSSRVVAWHGKIEEYSGPCDCVLSLHACGGASDAALRLASDRGVPFAISPCCIGKLRRGPASEWLQELLQELCQAEATDDPTRPKASTGKLFALLAAWADSEHVTIPAGSRGGVTAEGDAAAATAAHRRERCKLLVEYDRLIAKEERNQASEGSADRHADRILRITGRAMESSSQVEVLTGNGMGNAILG